MAVHIFHERQRRWWVRRALFVRAARLRRGVTRVEDERETRDAPLPLRRRTDETNDGRDVPGTSRFKRVEIVEMDALHWLFCESPVFFLLHECCASEFASWVHQPIINVQIHGSP